MSTIQELEPLGYTVGMAHGSVRVEEEALAAARAAADPTLIQEQANVIVADTVTALTKLDRIPKDESERLQMFAEMGEQAFKLLTEAVTEKVAFHERALANAQSSPDVWCVQQFAGDALIVQSYVSCKTDGSGWDDDAQSHLDALADKPSYAEREYQGLNPDAMQAAATLQNLGHVCTRPQPGADVFECDGTTYSAKTLLAFAEKAAAEPRPPTTAEKVAAAVAAAPELSDATKAALKSALA